MGRVAPALLFTVLIVSCYGTFGSKEDRTAASVDDPKVAAASKFALAELRKLCDYCSEDLRDTYQAMTIKELHSAETKPLALTDGTMYFLDLEVATPKPYRSQSSDQQVVIVFENKDGSYNGISMGRSPFLDK